MDYEKIYDEVSVIRKVLIDDAKNSTKSERKKKINKLVKHQEMKKYKRTY